MPRTFLESLGAKSADGVLDKPEENDQTKVDCETTLCGEGRREGSRKLAHASVHPRRKGVGKEGWQHGHSQTGVDATLQWQSAIFLAYSSSSSSETRSFLLFH